MHFDVGDRVHAAALGTGVVLEVRNAGRYLVEIKGRAVELRAAQLTPAPAEGRSRRRKPGVTAPALSSRVAPTSRGVPASIDLHGHTVDEAIEALDGFLNEAILAGLGEVQVIHGRSGGRVKAAAHARLRALPVVRAFRVDARNPGVTIVTL
jgi:DNA mismatch repair protein MutS2